MSKAEELLNRVICKAFAPKTRMPADEWAESHIVLDERFTALPGPFRLDRTPFMRQPHKWFSDPMVQEITCAASAQVSKTTWIGNCIMFAIAEDPGPILYVTTTEHNGKAWSEREFDKRVDACDKVRQLMPANPDDYKKLEKHFKSCTMAIVGSNSPSNLASRPIRYLFCDEVDKWPNQSAEEAPALQLAEQRTKSFKHRKKIVRASTPTIPKGQTWQMFLDGTQHRYKVTCPECQTRFPLEFFANEHGSGGVRWPDDCKNDANGEYDFDRIERESWYECPSCKGRIKQSRQNNLVANGEWEADNPRTRKGVISFHISELYSIPWGQTAVKYLIAKDNAGRLHDFYNSCLGLPWEPTAATVTDKQIQGILQASPGYWLGVREEGLTRIVLPLSTLVAKPMAVCMTVDVQKDSFWWLHRLWFDDMSSFLLDYGQAFTFEEVQDLGKLTYLLNDAFRFPVFGRLIDSGYKAKMDGGVYDFCLTSGFLPCQGRHTAHGFVTDAKELAVQHKTSVIKLIQFSDGIFKQELIGQKITTRSGPGWYLPQNVTQEYKKHLQGEQLTETTNERGEKELKWLVRGDNHLLDCEKMQLVFANTTIKIAVDALKARAANDAQAKK